jgi:tetratricopeptide (TPR) repeat protein
MGRSMTALEQARNHFQASEFAKAREVAREGLRSSPEDVELLRLAGRAGVEIGADDAVEELRRVTELQPDSVEAWRDLADALAAEGRNEEADDAFRKVLDLEPEDESALSALGHTAFQAGRRDDAVSMLEQVAARVGGTSTAHISLVEMYRTLGQHENALEAARKVADADPQSNLAALDVAELSLEVGDHDRAGEAFVRLRELTEFPEDEVAALQGLIKVELARGQLQRALELAREAGAIDTVGRTAGVLAHLEAEVGAEETPPEAIARGATMVFLQAQEAPPSRQEVEASIQATLADLRRKLIEDERPVPGEPGG